MRTSRLPHSGTERDLQNCRWWFGWYCRFDLSISEAGLSWRAVDLSCTHTHFERRETIQANIFYNRRPKHYTIAWTNKQTIQIPDDSWEYTRVHTWMTGLVGRHDVDIVIDSQNDQKLHTIRMEECYVLLCYSLDSDTGYFLQFNWFDRNTFYFTVFDSHMLWGKRKACKIFVFIVILRVCVCAWIEQWIISASQLNLRTITAIIASNVPQFHTHT